MKSFDKLVQVVEDIKGDVAKVDEGQNAAGTRVRKAMQEIKGYCKTVRDDVMKARKASKKTEKKAKKTTKKAKK